MRFSDRTEINLQAFSLYAGIFSGFFLFSAIANLIKALFIDDNLDGLWAFFILLLLSLLLAIPVLLSKHIQSERAKEYSAKEKSNVNPH